MLLKLVKIFSLIFLMFSFTLPVTNEIVWKEDINKVSVNEVEVKKLKKEIKKEAKKERPIGTINISKINLNNNLYSINSKLNTVDKNIEVLKSSDMPDVNNGNFILAAHSGFSSIAYFYNLYKLDIGDEVIINYNNRKYVYHISKIYDVMKTGKVSIKRDKNKRAITMITCKGKDKQLVVIGYLV